MAGSSFGKKFRVTTWGESHGPAIGVVIDGCPAGLAIDTDWIQHELDRRRPGQSALVTRRSEPDTAEILSGVYRGKATGAPISILIRNADTDSAKYDEIKNLFRPGHADYTYHLKYGIRDHRGGGRSSARETACRVAAGAIAKTVIGAAGAKITGSTVQVGNIIAKKYLPETIEKNPVRCADPLAAKKMADLIARIRKNGDSVGGMLELRATGVPAGLGEPVFDRLDAEIAKAIMSINAVKSVEIGAGTGVAAMKGSENNDQMESRRGKISFLSNNAGGILGGISTGQPIIVRAAVKPTPSIVKEQKTTDIRGKNAKIRVGGRHDPCLLPRAVPVAEAMLAIVIADHMLLAGKIKL